MNDRPQIRAFLTQALAFAFFACVSYLALLFLWGRLAPPIANLNYRIASYGHLYSRLLDARQAPAVDVLIAGSSHAYRGFDPRLFKANGQTAFNLGSSSQTPRQTEVLFDRYFEHLSPRLLILEVYPGSYALDGVESTLDLIANDGLDAPLTRMLMELPNAKVWNTYIYASMARGFSTEPPSASEPAERDGDRYISGSGYVERNGYYYRHDRPKSKSWTLNERNFEALDRVIARARKKGVAVWLVQAPYTEAMRRSYFDLGGFDRSAFDREMSKRAPYTDFNGLVALDDSLHFYDSDHLNQAGVERFNLRLFEVMDSLRSERVL